MAKALIISANFYKQISANLKSVVVDVLAKEGHIYDFVDVPGVFEIPAALSLYAKRKSYDLYVILGCVIRGETSHYDNITQEVFRAITDLVVEYELACGMGVVTTENYDQAVVRSTGLEKNSGLKAVNAALDMMKLYNSSV